MMSLDDCLQQLRTMHDHLCPRQVLGARMGLFAAELFRLDLPQRDKRLLTLVETDGCFADGVSVATGCTLGHRTLRLMDFGKVAATFIDTAAGAALRIVPRADSREAAGRLFEGAETRWHAQLYGYQVMRDEQLFLAQAVQLNFSVEALVSQPGIRTHCESCGEEILNEREVVLEGRTLCQSCAGYGYYVLDEQPSGALSA